MANPVTSQFHAAFGRDVLKAKILQTHGLGSPRETVRYLESCGICTWQQLGELPAKRWEQVKAILPPIRRGHEAADFDAGDRFGPGHLNSLNQLKAAAAEDIRKWKVLRENTAEDAEDADDEWSDRAVDGGSDVSDADA